MFAKYGNDDSVKVSELYLFEYEILQPLFEYEILQPSRYFSHLVENLFENENFKSLVCKAKICIWMQTFKTISL